tara:strand:- start:29 stop:925 length:897 start_codon:yes stop_codon:yes gene_type:complete
MQEELTKELVEENSQVDEGEVIEIETSEDSSDEVESEVVENEDVKTEDELVDYSDKVQKRIGNLTRRLREAERGQESAYEYAKRLRDENRNLKTHTSSLDKSYLDEAENRLKSQKAQAISALKNAHEVSDFDKVAKAQDILAKIAVEENKVVSSKQRLASAPQVQENDNFEQIYQPQSQPIPDPKSEDWAEKNSWFGDDESMTLAAFNIHRKLIEQESLDPATDAYYTEIDRRMREEFPHKFSEGKEVKSKPQQKVASANRADGKTVGKKQIRLSPSEVQMAKRLNVPLEEYAKYVKR